MRHWFRRMLSAKFSIIFCGRSNMRTVVSSIAASHVSNLPPPRNASSCFLVTYLPLSSSQAWRRQPSRRALQWQQSNLSNEPRLLRCSSAMDKSSDGNERAENNDSDVRSIWDTKTSAHLSMSQSTKINRTKSHRPKCWCLLSILEMPSIL